MTGFGDCVGDAADRQSGTIAKFLFDRPQPIGNEASSSTRVVFLAPHTVKEASLSNG